MVLKSCALILPFLCRVIISNVQVLKFIHEVHCVMGGNIAHLADGRRHNFDEGKDFIFDN